jgi:hypothetical protein
VIPVELMDLDLTPTTLKLLLHLWHAAVTKQSLLSLGLRSIAITLGMSVPTIRKSVAELEAFNVVRTTRGVGALTRYYITPKSQWRDPDTHAPLFLKNAGPEVCKQIAQSVGVKNSFTPAPIYSIDIKKDKKEGVQGEKEKGESVLPGELFATPVPAEKPKSDAERILDAYPTTPHGKRPDVTLKLIGKLLRKTPFDVLLKKVQLFAKTRQGKDPAYTPSPAKWFKEGRHNDHDHEKPTSTKSWSWGNQPAGPTA